ncbi:hypothetical protein EHS25_004153 [Saitozyma podzolica]|uniref:Uncharacterized protein n=1 Tax=Saitozyma podzolica TaxID=1890683 RepID=A0A427YTA1_9TREE|nr:hypothetical protein EHS25_004153 [Saitozyma podzolica]
MKLARTFRNQFRSGIRPPPRCPQPHLCLGPLPPCAPLAQRSLSSVTPEPAETSGGLASGTGRSRNPGLVEIPGGLQAAAGLQEIHRLLLDDIGGQTVWARRVEAAIADLGATRRYRIGVLGDDLAGPKDVVSALLQDPLADSEQSRTALLRRHEDSTRDRLVIGFRDRPGLQNDSLGLPASWLQASRSELVELRGRQLVNGPALLLNHIDARFVVNGPLPAGASEEDIEASLRTQLSDHGYRRQPEISFVRADLALKSFDALAVALAGTERRDAAFNVFQQDFLDSGIGPVQKAMVPKPPADFQSETATRTGRLALSIVDDVVRHDLATVKMVGQTVVELERDASAAASRARHLSVSSRGIEGGIVEGGVRHAVLTSKLSLENTLTGRLSWLGLVGRARVDDVASELGDKIQREFGAGLERQLVFESGQLNQLQSQLSAETDTTIRRLSSKSLRSEDAWVPRTYSVAATGIFASWAAYVEPLSLLSSETALGCGTLSVAASLVLGQSLWKRAERRFWKDFDRIVEMLQHDLQVGFWLTF